MWSSIANLKENLNKIALDVHDDDEELEIYSPSRNVENSPVSGRRNSHSFAHSLSPLSNGAVSSPYDSEIEQYKAEVKRLQESEAQIKALSVNYAALLKEKEEQISRLNKEYGSLKQNMDARITALATAKSETTRAPTASVNLLKGNTDQPTNRQHKIKSRAGNHQQNGASPKYDEISNGISHASQSDTNQDHSGSREKELLGLLEEKNRSLAAVQSTYESQIKQVKAELEMERDKRASLQRRYEEELKLNKSFQEELKSLKSDKQKTSMEISKIRSELNSKLSEISRLQMELYGRQTTDSKDTLKSLKRVIATLEKENTDLKREKNELESALESRISSSEASDSRSRSESEKVDLSHGFPGREEMELSLQRLEKELKETCRERDKAIQELARLKQHLLEKESEESEKMDEDSRVIEELRQHNEIQRVQISNMERSLKQAFASQEDVKMNYSKEIQKSKELIDDLNKEVADCMSTIDAKNVELLNLQTALGQYYAEIEAKEHLEADLARAKEEVARVLAHLKDADQQAEATKKEKEEILGKLAQNERTLADWKHRVTKLEEDNAKLRRALEQSMTRLNRMSSDSDYLVDRRIVIKLLVTYFQRNHSKEVLDLMVRMLGFSDEDKQRIGVAQHGAGKGVVRGVLGIPGRLVGGILGGSSTEAHGNVASDNQSFADLWVDFLLKETEERERREMEGNAATPKENTRTRNSGGTSPPVPANRVYTHGRESGFSSQYLNPGGASPPVAADRVYTPGRDSGFSSQYLSPSQNSSTMPSHGTLRHSGSSDSEFSNVPLTTENSFQISRLPPRY